MTNLDHLRGYIELLTWAKAEKAKIKEIEDAAKAVIEEALGDSDEGTVDGETVVVWKSHKRTALDQRLLKQLFPDAAAECMSTTEVRRFEVVS
jgi:predicted phage-related endonuclease